MTLAENLRPKTINEVIGQKHLVGNNKILSNMIKNNFISSIILYGNPGIGKTSIASAISNDLNIINRQFNATVNSKKDLTIIFEEAKMYKKLILIVDEIHRLNKDKQDLLLPYLESGIIILIGLTTANPYNRINPAIRSRCHILKLENLNEDDLLEGLNLAVESEYLKDIKIDDESIKYLIRVSNYDLRTLYNTLELAYNAFDKVITIDNLKSIINKPVLLNDKDGDSYYDLLSALQKSIRGSDADAAIYYLARLLINEDLEIIHRRLAVIAYEDIYLANPSIGGKVDSAINLSNLVGMPESRLILAPLVIEMALSPKSNSAHIAIDMALSDVNAGASYEIPKHIKNHSDLYKYPHDYKYSYVDQQYLPDRLKDKTYYIPKNNTFELNLKKTKEILKNIK